MRYRCSVCGQEYPLETRQWQCECGGLFEFESGIQFSDEVVQRGVPTLWRYRALLPVHEDRNVVSLGEGFTPLVRSEIYGHEVWFKSEFLGPTGSFKDRGATVLISVLKELGISTVVEDSSGNAAASIAAYCARAGIHARIFVPAHASPAKLAQIAIYGAELVPIEGPRENSAVAAQEAARDAYYASHNYNPLFVEGTKTFAYEIWEQLGCAPDNVVLPVGNGSLFMGAYIGFKDLAEAGLIDNMPRLFGVQAKACAPIYEAFVRGDEDARPVESGKTAAEGIHIARPVRGRVVLRAVGQTDGKMLAVDEAEIRSSQSDLAQQGLFVEPTSAVAVAALQRLAAVLEPGQMTVVGLTGSGLKSD
jgi:threonine synthase